MARGMCLAVLALSLALPARAETNVEGVSETGAPYWIVVPDDWNGDLVLLLHGYTDPASPLVHPDFVNDLRDAFAPLGYAVAYSSWSRNGWAVAEATEDTHALRGIFQQRFGRPRFTYVAGKSLGALAGLKLAQQHGSVYDGLLALCGPIGGGAPAMERVIHVRALFDYFFPGPMTADGPESRLGGSLAAPVALTPDQVTEIVIAAVSGNFLAALELAGVTQAGLHGQWLDANELIAALVYQLSAHTRGTADITERAGALPVGNAGTIYTGSIDDAALNAGIARVPAGQNGDKYLARYYFPDAWLGFPVVTLHNARDPYVTSANQAAFSDVIRDDENVIHRRSQAFGHCVFDPASEIVPAFGLLTSWVETGRRPR